MGKGFFNLLSRSEFKYYTILVHCMLLTTNPLCLLLTHTQSCLPEMIIIAFSIDTPPKLPYNMTIITPVNGRWLRDRLLGQSFVMSICHAPSLVKTFCCTDVDKNGWIITGSPSGKTGLLNSSKSHALVQIRLAYLTSLVSIP